ncbi:MAG: S8 family peptidase [Aquiluna sp.]|jgi:subtilisin family serine protease
MKRISAFLLAVLLVIPTQASANVVEPAYDAVNLSHAWSLGYKGAGATVAIIDQGLNLDHPYFKDKVIDGYCFVEATSSLRCPNGTREQSGPAAASQRKIGSIFLTDEDHGNMVAGLVAGNPTAEAPGGVAPDAKILMANVDLTLNGILAALRYIKERREALNIVALSMSWGGYFTEIPRSWLQCDTNPQLAELATLLTDLRKAGVIPFASAGNTPTLEVATSVFPSCLKDVVAVASVNNKNEISWYVTMSSKVELLAPDYARSANTFSYIQSSGTSAAAPVVAGSFAILRQAFPTRTPEQILSVMKSTGTKISDVIRKNIPMVDMKSAVTALQAGTVTPQPGQTLNVGTFNGKIVVYARGYTGSTISWKIAGRWQKVTVTQDFQAFDRLTRAVGVDVTVDIYVNGSAVPAFSKTVRTR